MIPLFHELATAFNSVGDVLTGNVHRAKERWNEYAKESVVGSGCSALHHTIHNNHEQANEYGKSMGRATGQALAGGGLLSDVPVFQELAVAGQSLGDCMAGESEKASLRWTEDYLETSCIGSGIQSEIEKSNGNNERANQLRERCGKAWAKGAITAAVLAASAATAGAAAPLGAVGAAAATAAVDAGTSALGMYAFDKIDGTQSSAGDYLGGSLFAGATGAAGGYKAGKAAGRSNVYRTTPKIAGDEAVKNQKFPVAFNQDRPLGETWFSESSSHQREFLKIKKSKEPELQHGVYKGKIDKNALKAIKEDSISQKGSKQKNRILLDQKQKPKNVLNDERTARHGRGKINIGIKTPNLPEFNDKIQGIKKINLNSPKYRLPGLRKVYKSKILYFASDDIEYESLASNALTGWWGKGIIRITNTGEKLFFKDYTRSNEGQGGLRPVHVCREAGFSAYADYVYGDDYYNIETKMADLENGAKGVIMPFINGIKSIPQRANFFCWKTSQ